MSILAQQSGQEISIDRNLRDVFGALQEAAENSGTVRDARPSTGTIVVRTFLVLFPPQNPATVRISVESSGEKKTKVRFQSDSVDGLVGFGSAGGAIDRIIADMDSVLAGKPMQKRARRAGFKAFLVISVLLITWILYLILTVRF